MANWAYECHFRFCMQTAWAKIVKDQKYMKLIISVDYNDLNAFLYYLKLNFTVYETMEDKTMKTKFAFMHNSFCKTLLQLTWEHLKF